MSSSVGCTTTLQSVAFPPTGAMLRALGLLSLIKAGAPLQGRPPSSSVHAAVVSSRLRDGQFILPLQSDPLQLADAALTSLRRAFSSQAEVWTWGKGEEGQLGHAVENLEKQPRRVDPLVYTTTPPSEWENPQESLPDVKEFKGQVSCGLFHSAALSEGLLFTWGKGQGGRLGIGDDQPRYQPARVPLDDVSAVALGGLHSLAVTADGRAWSWGFGMFGALGHGDFSNQYEPMLITGPWLEEGDRAVAVAGGGAHSALVAASGALYIWGRDEGEGRLGVRAALSSGGSSSPQRVHGIEGRVVSVACGGFHTICLTDDGRVWSFGANANGELGRDSGADAGPQVVRALEGTRCRHVACGGYHSAAVTEDGVLLTWGHGGHAQLGHVDLRGEKAPREVEALRGLRVSTTACGGNWTSAVTEDGRLFSWGKNRDSQLGRPLSRAIDMEPTPREVQLVRSEDGLTRRAVAVAAGAHHAAALVLATD